IGQIADTVKAGDFYEERHRIIFEAIVSLYDSHRPIDLLTLSDALKKSKQLDKVGGSSYLAELTNQVPTASNVEYYAEIVAEKAVRRRLIKAAQNISKLSYDEEQPVNRLLAQSEADLFAVSQ